jgi:hypothetical protein
MSELQEVEVVLEKDGTVRVHVRGVRGQACVAITKPVEEMLGGKVLERQHTDEYLLDENTEEDRVFNRG